MLDNSSSTEIARDLGSDIEFFIDEGSALISGKGNVDQRLKINSDKHFLIVFPNVQNSTKNIFNIPVSYTHLTLPTIYSV